jgi:hypothetical protein
MHKPELLTQAQQDELENFGYGEYDEWAWHGYIASPREIYDNIDRMWEKEVRAVRLRLVQVLTNRVVSEVYRINPNAQPWIRTRRWRQHD